MSSTTTNNDFFKSNVLGHPAGLFVLFFTEMWERFSFYGMRILLVIFLTAAMGVGVENPGFGMPTAHATAIYGTYAMLLYLTPILGGIIADKFTGYRWAVVIGSIIMTLGHVAMAIETPFWVYMGLGLLVAGTGFFKPNMTSILSEMYKDVPEKKDGAYTIFYMGVNAGAFFGMMLCGYLGEKIGWSYGFGLAGVFMLLGTLQFWLAKPLFGKIGEVPSKVLEVEPEQGINEKSKDFDIKGDDADKRNPFTLVDKILIVISSAIGLGYAINDPLSKINKFSLFPFETTGILNFILILIGVYYMIWFIRFLRKNLLEVNYKQNKVVKIVLFSLIGIWLVYQIYNVLNSGISFDFSSLFNITLQGEYFSIIVGLYAFLYLVFTRISRYDAEVRHKMISVVIFAFFTVFFWLSFEQGASSLVLFARDSVDRTLDGTAFTIFKVVNTLLTIIPLLLISWVLYLLGKQTWKKIPGSNIILIITFIGVWAVALWMLGREYGAESGEIAVSWFSILNSFFIIAFANLISKWWESKYNPSAAMKYGFGLIIMAIGFGLLAYGANGIEPGMKVSMAWLILAYLFHTLGELCLSPVGLSYVSKLVPPRMIALMFGMWYLAIAIGNKLAAVAGGEIEDITKEHSLSVFFLIFTIVPAVAGLIVMSLNPVLKKLMHGVK